MGASSPLLPKQASWARAGSLREAQQSVILLRGMTMMHRYKVGEPYSATRSSWPEAQQFNVRGGEFELTLFFRAPKPKEVRSVKRGKSHFAALSWGPVLNFLYAFEPAIKWSDAPFTIHALPPKEQVLPEIPDGQDRALLNVVLVDADTGLIRALRVVSLSADVTAVIGRVVTDQLASKWDPDEYHRALKQMQVHSVRDLLDRADVRCIGGK